jgi:hypothetical protein
VGGDVEVDDQLKEAGLDHCWNVSL